jgi:hypothetical protein
MAIPNQYPTTIGACVEGTADATTATTAVALPAGAAVNGAQLLAANTGSALCYIKLGPSTGPDASSTTTGGGRAAMPAGSIQVFTVKSSQTHAYLYSATTTTFNLMAADGP